MKTYYVFIIILFLFNGFLKAQTAEDFHKKGIELASVRNYKAAIAEYDKALNLDSTNIDFWSDRGAANFAIQNYKEALLDYTSAILINPKDENAIYNHAVCWAAMKKRRPAVISIDHLLAINPKNGSAWLFRAQMMQSMNIGDTACIDFQYAYDLHEPTAGQYLQAICKRTDVIREDYVLPIEDNKEWNGITRENDEKQVFREILKKGESSANFTESVSEMIYKEKTIPLKPFMEKLVNDNRKLCSGLKVTFIKYDSASANPSMVFMMECPGYKSSTSGQSQLVKLIQGKINTYLVAITSSSPKLSEDFIKRWSLFLVKGKIEER